jgi:Ca-activated chloride channel homolog
MHLALNHSLCGGRRGQEVCLPCLAARRLPTAPARRKLHLLCALLVLLLLTAHAAQAQSGRRTTNTPTNPSTTQRPRRATTNTSKEKSTSSNKTSSTSGAAKSNTGQQPAPVLQDDAPPPPVTKKVVPQTQAEPDVEVGPEDVVRITSNLVTVPASVVDSYGRALMGLKLEDFELRVDGQVKAISELSYSDSPVRLALLFDNSSSLTTAREFEKQAAVRFFRSVMRPADQAAVYNVYTEVELAQPLTSDVRSLVRTIENFGKPEGATRLFDAIVQAANYLRPQAGRKVIIIVSDGEDTLSDSTFDDALRIAQAADCQIYAVQTKQIEYVMQTGQPLGNANLRALAAERRLQEFAAQTGGAVYSPLAVPELDNAFSQISADLAQQYVLSYYPADERQDGRYRAISLRVVSHPDARVRARKGYYASRAAMRSNINWQSGTTGGASAASIDPSDTVPKEAGQGEVFTPVSSNTSGVTRAPEIRVVSANNSTKVTPAAALNTDSRPQPEPEPMREAVKTEPVIQPARPKEGNQPQTQASQTTTPLQASTTKPVSGGVLNGKALSLPKPDYPLTARAANASGTVVVEVVVDETGKVISARATGGHPMLRNLAVNAARLARFAPTKLSGQPVQVKGVITYNFVTR